LLGGKAGQLADILITGPQVSAPVSGQLEVAVSFTLGASYGTDSTARRVTAFLGRSVNDTTLIGTSMPIVTATGSTQLVNTYSMVATFAYTANEVIQPFLALNRQTTGSTALVTKALPSASGANNSTDKVYGAEWRATLIKR
jgi:hypothetical protein